MRPPLACALFFALVSPSGTARGQENNLLVLDPPQQSIVVGEDVELDLLMDFLDTTVGGAVTVSVDPAILAIDSIVFDPEGNLGDQLDFRCPTDPQAANPVPCPDDPSFLSFGSFGGLDGMRSVARLRFTPHTVGTTEISVDEAFAFSDVVGGALPVSFAFATVHVPEPARDLLAVLALATCAVTARPGRAKTFTIQPAGHPRADHL
jgi:hypothetical protein